MTAALTPRYLTLSALAEYTSLSESTLRRAVADGEIPPPVKVRDCIRYDREAVDAALAKKSKWASQYAVDDLIRKMEVGKRGRKAA